MRFGLFGTGYWAAETHASALAAHPDIQLVGVWGRDPAKADTLAQRFGAKAYSDVDALLAEVEAIAVALPPDIQAELATKAAQAGRHLLLDKPTALTTPAADRLAAAADAARVASVVFFTNRFAPEIVAFLDDQAAIGGWYAGRVIMHGSIFQAGSPYGSSPWRREHGGLWDIGPHALSIVVPMLGDVAEVTAVAGPRETTNVIARHRDTAASELSLTLNAAPNAVAFETVFYGEHGVAVLPDRRTSAVEAFGNAISELLSAVDSTDRRHPCDVHFGQTVVRVLAAAEQARQERRAVAV